ncbi:MAG: phosphate acetyltransferase [Peptoniphilaceae bacterium]|nr:phosphate acetyltransferase [Peptoniphilaceae bacterium]MDY3738545.1 phosphate acetyltransferase [Peptoniphilaceae bacterium]
MIEEHQIIKDIKKNISGKNLRIVFPEGEDPRVLRAALRHKEDGYIIPILLGDMGKIQKVADKEGVKLGDIEIIDVEYAEDFDELVDAFVERRKGKNTKRDGQYLLKDPNYYGTMMVYTGKADGMVSGAIHPTGDTVRPALQIIKTKPGIKRVSGAMLMLGPNGEKYLFADTAINMTLQSHEMAEIAIESAQTAQQFGIEPIIAMLSFSTKGSANSEDTHKVAEATEIAKEKRPDLKIDGEMQFDAALVPEVGKQKAPNSDVAGKAKVFIFPSLEAANIGYKIGQRFGHYEALGPILQGLNAPVNDLSRGCVEEDVYKLAILTANQVEK